MFTSNIKIIIFQSVFVLVYLASRNGVNSKWNREMPLNAVKLSKLPPGQLEYMLKYIEKDGQNSTNSEVNKAYGDLVQQIQVLLNLLKTDGSPQTEIDKAKKAVDNAQRRAKHADKSRWKRLLKRSKFYSSKIAQIAAGSLAGYGVFKLVQQFAASKQSLTTESLPAVHQQQPTILTTESRSNVSMISGIVFILFLAVGFSAGIYYYFCFYNKDQELDNSAKDKSKSGSALTTSQTLDSVSSQSNANVVANPTCTNQDGFPESTGFSVSGSDGLAVEKAFADAKGHGSKIRRKVNNKTGGPTKGATGPLTAAKRNSKQKTPKSPQLESDRRSISMSGPSATLSNF